MQADLRSSARFCPPPPFALVGGKKETAAMAQGRRYEEKALPYLEQWAKRNGYSPLSKQWIEYRDLLGQVRWCQPDFVALGDTTDNLIIVEVKLRHTRDAFRQMNLYSDLLAEIYPCHHICKVEFCRYFAPEEFKTTLLPQLSPHNLPHAAVLWEPSPVSITGETLN